MTQQRAQARKIAAERAGAGALFAPGREKGAEIGRAQFPDIAERRGPGEVAGEEGQELAGVTLIGIERVLGKATLASEVFEPRGAFRHQARIGDNQ